MMDYTEQEFSTEIWKDVPDYEGLYEFSNLGRLRSCSREAERIYKDGRISNMTVESKVYTPYVTNTGVIQYLLRKDGHNTMRSMNALMLEIFPDILSDSESSYSKMFLPQIPSLDGEVWENLPNYRHVKVSNKGRIKKDLVIIHGSKGTNPSRVFKPKLLTPVAYHDSKQLYVKIGEPGEHRYLYTRLDAIVAEAFLTKPEGECKLIHKNGDYADCSAENLEWVNR